MAYSWYGDAHIPPSKFSICLIRITKVLPQGVNISLYAGDVCVWASDKNRRSIRAKLQKALFAIQKYLITCGLLISLQKCASVAFTRRDVSRYLLVINDTEIPYIINHKFRGVTLDRSLSWAYHIRRLRERLHLFLSIFRMLTGKTGATQCFHYYGFIRHFSLVFCSTASQP